MYCTRIRRMDNHPFTFKYYIAHKLPCVRLDPIITYFWLNKHNFYVLDKEDDVAYSLSGSSVKWDKMNMKVVMR